MFTPGTSSAMSSPFDDLLLCNCIVLGVAPIVGVPLWVIWRVDGNLLKLTRLPSLLPYLQNAGSSVISLASFGKITALLL